MVQWYNVCFCRFHAVVNASLEKHKVRFYKNSLVICLKLILIVISVLVHLWFSFDSV